MKVNYDLGGSTKFKPAQIKLTTIILLGTFALPFLIGDYVTTTWLISAETPGMIREANPVVASLYSDFGHNGLLMGKVATFLLIGGVVYLIDMKFCSRLDRLKEWSVLILIGFYMVVVLNNTLVILSLGAT
ncbi:MAG: DUF5658 family protein [Nitrososphaerales archaeon]